MTSSVAQVQAEGRTLTATAAIIGAIIAVRCEVEAATRKIPWLPVEGTYFLPTERDRRRFKMEFSRWNAAGLRRLPPSRFENAVNLILKEPRLYTTIHPGATFEDPADEVD